MAICKNLVLAAGLLLAGRPLDAQAVRGELVESVGGRPVAGAFVVLLDGAGKQVGGGFTDAAGAFLVQAPGPGSYSLRAERVGFDAARSPALRLGAGETVTHGLEMGSRAVQLEGLVVQAEKRRCAALAQAGEATAALWEEARKALGAAAWTESRRRFRYTIQRHVRTMDVALRVQAEEGERLTGFAGSPFVSVPAERLAREGFSRQEGDSTAYFAPDAAVLLSDEFLDTHCFRVQPGEGETRALVGLAFEPVRGRGLPDVRGALWLDPGSAELRHLEFEYTGLELRGATSRLGGRVEFERLPSGEWIVPRWRIRVPVVGADTLKVGANHFERRRMAGIREAAGEVLEVRSLAGELIRSTQRASLAGVVFDSTRLAPLAGAQVRLAGTAVEARTDAEGRFRIADVSEGRFSVVFSHPRADSLEYSAPPRTVDLRRGADNEVGLALPPLAAVLAARCSPAERRAGTGVVAGTVRAEGASPPPGTPVLLTWAATGAAPAGRAVAWTDVGGRYVACAVPPGVAVLARAGSPAGMAAEVRASADRPTLHDLALPAPRAVVLEGLAVVAASPEERAARASGTRTDLVLRGEIEALRSVAGHVGDLVRRFPGVTIQENFENSSSGIATGVCVVQRRKTQDSQCAAVIVDDVLVPEGMREIVARPLLELESVQFIPSVAAMGRYGTEARGGALVIYTAGKGPHARRPGTQPD
jgi:hypothetical protein